MKIAVIGTGYVGLTAGTCLAESGNDVIGIDIDRVKVDMLSRGQVPIYEPGLGELVENNVRSGRLRFSTDMEEGIRDSLIIFIAIGTPTTSDGLPDISQVEKIARQIVTQVTDYRIIVIKSTVPVGTTVRLQKELAELTDKPFDLAVNPEFLKEGYAVEDFLRPDRVILGTQNPQTASILEELYAPFVRNGKPILVMDPTSAEMTKYAANAMLSTKISFINEMANLCQRLGGDIDAVRRGICTDSRIGFQFLYPGLGFGGSCFPKDLLAMVRLAEKTDYPAWLLKAVLEVNEFQKTSLQRKIKTYFSNNLRGKTFGIWGLSFKPRTDDIRESAALGLIADLLAAGAKVKVHDPKAMDNMRKIFPDAVEYCNDMYDALADADGLCLVTEWNEFRNPSFEKILQLMKTPVIFDGRNVYDAEKMRHRGFIYFGIGRG
ncbi:MAG: UDP-glucose/GDP-mannose dehydrogenase family protein [Phycisphaerae bacterium]